MQVYVSYVYSKLQWNWPVHYADLGFQLKFKMAAPKTKSHFTILHCINT